MPNLHITQLTEQIQRNDKSECMGQIKIKIQGKERWYRFRPEMGQQVNRPYPGNDTTDVEIQKEGFKY